jgi:hypothetical protein
VILCESFYVLLEYARTAMFMWMFIEGMYLNKLISVAYFQRPDSYKLYYIIGWGEFTRCQSGLLVEALVVNNPYKNSSQ